MCPIAAPVCRANNSPEFFGLVTAIMNSVYLYRSPWGKHRATRGNLHGAKPPRSRRLSVPATSLRSAEYRANLTWNRYNPLAPNMAGLGFRTANVSARAGGSPPRQQGFTSADRSHSDRPLSAAPRGSQHANSQTIFATKSVTSPKQHRSPSLRVPILPTSKSRRSFPAGILCRELPIPAVEVRFDRFRSGWRVHSKDHSGTGRCIGRFCEAAHQCGTVHTGMVRTTIATLFRCQQAANSVRTVQTKVRVCPYHRIEANNW